VVDRSLEGLAADRGITICFADLDGAAEGLWLPEERTIMLARGLSSRRAAEVLEHELSHVDIEDGHAALDAGVGQRRVVRARWAVAGTAVACLALLLGITRLSDQPVRTESVPEAPVVAVDGTPSPPPAAPTVTTAPTTTVGTRVVDAEVRTRTVTVTAPATTARPPASAAETTIPRVAPGPSGPQVVDSGEPSETPSVLPGGNPTPTTTTSPSPDPSGSTSPTPSVTAAGTEAAEPWLAVRN
jgi:hypothetical protein